MTSRISISPAPTSVRLRRSLVAPLLAASLALISAGCSNSPDEDDVAAASALVEQGITRMQAGNVDRATEDFERALRLDEGQALAHYNLGVIDQGAERLDEAAAHYDAALEIDPKNGPTLYNSAILNEGKDLDEAIDTYRRAIEADPDFAPAYMRIGFALNHQGRTAEAAPFLEKGLELDPSMADVEAPSYD